ncbi:MAG: hypothetical protein JXD22_05545 [Sedimentisphaerales bacterium]|nr:hypothetical protein [Sedimentisphaerales bacterium]
MKHIAFLYLVIFLSTPLFSFADDYYWIDPAGGELGDGTKWDQGVAPGEDDYVYFTEPNSYTIWLDDYYTHDRMTVEGSDLALDLNGKEYTLDTTNDNNRSVVIGNFDTGSVTVSGGGVYCHDMFMAWNGGDSVGRLNLSGAETFWQGHEPYGNWYGFFYGATGDAEINVTDDAQLIHGHGQCSIGSESTSKFNIDGQNSEWFVSGFFEMSAYGKTTANVSNGARARMGLLKMATYRGSAATINVTGKSHEAELAIENYWNDPNGLHIGGAGKGIINLTGSKMLLIGHTTIGEKAGGEGELNIYDGSWAELLGSVAVGGSLQQAGGKGLVYLYDDPHNGDFADLNCATEEEGQFMVVWPDGTIRMDGGEISLILYAYSYANPIDLRGGTLEGRGVVRAYVNNYGGVVFPGAMGGGYDEWNILDIDYDYTQDADGTLKIPIMGDSGGDGWNNWNYGGLRVNGQATLDGFLDVDLWNDYVPVYTDEYVIVEAASVSGQFINAASEYVFEGGTFEVVYEPDRVILTHFESEPRCTEYPIADFNKDCMVNLVDFSILASQWLDCNLEPTGFCP